MSSQRARRLTREVFGDAEGPMPLEGNTPAIVCLIVIIVSFGVAFSHPQPKARDAVTVAVVHLEPSATATEGNIADMTY